MRREDKEAMKLLQCVNLYETLEELKRMESQKLLEMYMEYKIHIEEEMRSKRVADIIMYVLRYAYRHASGLERHKKSTSANHERSA